MLRSKWFAILLAALASAVMGAFFYIESRHEDSQALFRYTDRIAAPLSSPLSQPLSASTSAPVSSPIAPVAKGQTYLLLGDSGTGSARQQAVADAMVEYCKGTVCRAAYIAGDVIYDNGVRSVDDSQFRTKFETPYAALDIPFFIAYGNHDYRGCRSCYLEYADQSDKWQMPAAYYLVQEPAVDFFIIDTENFDPAQQAWLATTLEASTAPWRIIIGHKPLLTNEREYHDLRWPGKAELQTILCNRADLYVSGHAHILEDVGTIEPACHIEQIISGGGGITPRTMYAKPLDHFFLEDNGFVAVTATPSRLELSFLNSSAEVLSSRALSASSSPMLP